MALIVEDGSIVADANTYLTEAEANTLLEGYGFVLTPATAEANLRTAAQYLESFRRLYQGAKVSSAQTLQFPRQGLLIDCFLIASDTIPEQLKIAQALAAYEESVGKNLQATSNGQTIIEKSVAGAVTVKYADHSQNSAQLNFPQIDTQIEPLLKQRSGLEVFRK